MPSRSIVFFCLALSKILGSSKISGVGCRVSTPGGAVSRSRDCDASGVIVSGRDSLIFVDPVSPLLSVVVFPEVIPHATRDRNTATKHSKPSFRSCCSVYTGEEVSWAPVSVAALVLRDGGMSILCGLGVVVTIGLDGSLPFCGAELDKAFVPILVIMFIRLNIYKKVRRAQFPIILNQILTVHICCQRLHYHNRN
jgi:hypothetical protein